MKLADVKQNIISNSNGEITDESEIVIENTVGTVKEYFDNLPDYGWDDEIGEEQIVALVVMVMQSLI